MDKLFKRITAVQHDENGNSTSVVLYKKKRGRVGKTVKNTSVLLRPLERAVRYTLIGVSRGADEGYDRHLSSGKRKNNRWLLDGPSNFMKAGRKSYNVARKGAPFRLLPKMG